MPKPQIPFHCNVIVLPSSFPQSQLSQSGHSHQILMDVVANCNLYHDIISSHFHLNFNFHKDGIEFWYLLCLVKMLRYKLVMRLNYQFWLIIASYCSNYCLVLPEIIPLPLNNQPRCLSGW